MVQKPLTKEDYLRPKILSKVKFSGDFEKELKNLIKATEESIEKNLSKRLCITSIMLGNNNIKLWIEDEDRHIFRIVNCIFRYDATNKKFGYCNIELNSTEISKKPRLHYVGKFGILEKQSIVVAILRDIEKSLEEIY